MAKYHRPRQGTGIAVSHFHLVDPLPVSEVLDSPEMERALLMEALNRGAGTLELFRMLKTWRAQRQRRHPRTVFGLLNFDDVLVGGFADQAETFLVRQCREDYDRMLRDEFSSLPDDVHDSFAFDKHEPFAYYCQMRPVFYRAGYSDPCETIFLKIEPAQFLGHNVAGGLHEVFRDRLARLERELDSWSPGLSQRLSSQIKNKNVGGFVPRYIAPKQGHRQKAPSLSNHAFGLAIDIDPDWNPHIKDQEVVDVLKEITGYDFGQVLVPKEKGIPEMDRIAQTHARVHEASDRLRTWLKRYLPVYEAELRKASTPASFPTDPAAPPVCEDPSEESKQIIRLLKYHKLAELKQWSTKGIESVPLELAAAMANLGFRWGGSYEHSKDIMHFELEAKDALKPDQEARSLEDGLFAGNEFALRMWLQNKADRAEDDAQPAGRSAASGGDAK
jgi:D-alanyl-D-alanine carboxypeptidase